MRFGMTESTQGDGHSVGNSLIEYLLDDTPRHFDTSPALHLPQHRAGSIEDQVYRSGGDHWFVSADYPQTAGLGGVLVAAFDSQSEGRRASQHQHALFEGAHQIAAPGRVAVESISDLRPAKHLLLIPAAGFGIHPVAVSNFQSKNARLNACQVLPYRQVAVDLLCVGNQENGSLTGLLLQGPRRCP